MISDEQQGTVLEKEELSAVHCCPYVLLLFLTDIYIETHLHNVKPRTTGNTSVFFDTVSNTHINVVIFALIKKKGKKRSNLDGL